MGLKTAGECIACRRESETGAFAGSRASRRKGLTDQKGRGIEIEDPMNFISEEDRRRMQEQGRDARVRRGFDLDREEYMDEDEKEEAYEHPDEDLLADLEDLKEDAEERGEKFSVKNLQGRGRSREDNRGRKNIRDRRYDRDRQDVSDRRYDRDRQDVSDRRYDRDRQNISDRRYDRNRENDWDVDDDWDREDEGRNGRVSSPTLAHRIDRMVVKATWVLAVLICITLIFIFVKEGFLNRLHLNLPMGNAQQETTEDGGEQEAQAGGQQNGVSVVTTHGLNLRDAPSSQSNVVLTVTEGTQMMRTADDGTWSTVTYNGKQYYCASKFLKVG